MYLLLKLKIRGQIWLLTEKMDCSVDQKSDLGRRLAWDSILPLQRGGKKNQIFLNTQEETFSADPHGFCWKNSSFETDNQAHSWGTYHTLNESPEWVVTLMDWRLDRTAFWNNPDDKQRSRSTMSSPSQPELPGPLVPSTCLIFQVGAPGPLTSLEKPWPDNVQRNKAFWVNMSIIAPTS